MNRKIIFLFVLVMLAGIIIFPTFAAEQLYKIAVLPFDDGSIKDRWWGNNWQVGSGVSDELVTALLDTNRFRLIEREKINKVLHEQDFGNSGRVDPSSAAKIGKVLGVQFLVMGKVTEFSFKTSGGAIATHTGVGLGIKTTTALVAIDARLVNSTTAEIIAGVTGKGDKKQTNVAVVANWNAIAFGSSEFKQTILGQALRDSVVQVANGLAEKAYGKSSTTTGAPSAISGMVAYASANKVIINIGSGDGVQNGMTFVIYHVIEVVKDPKTGEIIDEVTEPVAEIAVTEVKDKSSTCAVMTRLSSRYSIANGDSVKQKM